MWHVTDVSTPSNERVTILGGEGDDLDFHSVGDRFGPEGSRYLVYVQGVGGLVLRDVGHIKDGPHHWAVQVNGNEYWWYAGEGHCKLSVDRDGSFTLGGDDNEVTGTVVPDGNIQYAGREVNSLAVTLPSSGHVGSQTEWFPLPNASMPWIDPLDDGDKIKLRAASQKYLTTDDGNQVVDGAKSRSDGSVIAVEQTAAGDYLKIDGNYVRVDSNDGTLHADASKGDATTFETVLTPLGTVRVRTGDGKLLRVASTGSRDTVLEMDDVTYNDPSAALELVLKGMTTEELEAQIGASLTEFEDVSCLKQKGKVAWQLFMGFFRILGLTSWYQGKQEEMRRALWGVIERHPNVKHAIETIVDGAKKEWQLSAGALLNLLTSMWSSGALVKAVKLWFGTGWLMVTRIVLTIVNWLGWLFKNVSGWGAAAAAAESVAGWSMWIVNLSDAVVDLYKCETSAA